MYGLRLWRLRGAVAAALAVCVTTGGLTVYNVIFSNEPAPELIEVPLMTMMVLATIWHVRSRQKAAAVVAAVADERQRMIERERTFFGNVTHDLMTPITVARGHIDILGRTGPPSPDELAETKQVIIEELRRIESMVGDLLLVGRLDQDAGLQTAKLDVEDFLHVVADSLEGGGGADVHDRRRRARRHPRGRQHPRAGARQRDRERRVVHRAGGRDHSARPRR